MRRGTVALFNHAGIRPPPGRLRGSWSLHEIKSARSLKTKYLSTIASDASSSATVAFDRGVKLLQRDGSARMHGKRLEKGGSHTADQTIQDDSAVDYDYFRREIASRLVDRLDDIRLEGGFPLALDIGAFS